MVVSTTSKDIRVLIVEDDHDDAFLIKEIVETGMPGNNMKIDFSYSYMEAIYSISQVDYDICLFDYYLGEINGLELLEAVRARGYTMPIIFLTGDTDPRTALEAMASGATDLFFKSDLTPELLCPSINYAIEMNEAKKLEAELDAARADAHSASEKLSCDISSVICELKPDGTTMFINNASSKITGYKPHEIIGKNWWEVFANEALEDSSIYKKNLITEGEIIIKTKHAKTKVLEWNVTNNYSDSGELESMICVGIDITDRVHLREELYSMSLFDEITGLRNKRGFYKLAEDQLRISRRDHKELALFFIKLNFENSLQLAEITNPLKLAFRETDIMAYLGDGNIAVLATNVTSIETIQERLWAGVKPLVDGVLGCEMVDVRSLVYDCSNETPLEQIVAEMCL